MRNYLLTGLVVFTLSCSNTKKMKEASTDTGKQTYVQGSLINKVTEDAVG